VTPFRFNRPLLSENMGNSKEERILKKTVMLYLEAHRKNQQDATL
jgi:hypothetical protein